MLSSKVKTKLQLNLGLNTEAGVRISQETREAKSLPNQGAWSESHRARSLKIPVLR